MCRSPRPAPWAGGPTRDRSIAEQSKNYRYSTAHQVVIDADARVVVVVGRKGWKILHDCRLKGDGVHHAMLGITRLYNLALTG